MRRRTFLSNTVLSSSALALLASALPAWVRGRSLSSPLQPPSPLPPPSPLRSGSRLRALNLGTWIAPDTDFTPLQNRCAAQGWHLEIPASVRRQWQWFAGTDAQRCAALLEAWRDPSLDGLIVVGAGWGGARVLEAGFQFPRRSLWTLGFSDTSSLLLAQWAAGSRGAIHGSSGGSEAQWQRTVELLSGRAAAPLTGRAVRPGRVTGPLVVTNLTVATHLIGTPWWPSLEGAILVLEDVGEAPYRVDRMLTHWRTAGVLRGVAGIGTGRFSWEEDDILPGDFSMAAILEERLGDLGVPLVMDLPVGHGQPNLALPLGQMALLDGRSGSLSLR